MASRYILTGKLDLPSSSWSGTWVETVTPDRKYAFSYTRLPDSTELEKYLPDVPLQHSEAHTSTPDTVVLQNLSATAPSEGSGHLPRVIYWKGTFTYALQVNKPRTFSDHCYMLISSDAAEGGPPGTFRVTGRGKNLVGFYSLVGGIDAGSLEITADRIYDPKDAPVKHAPRPRAARPRLDVALLPVVAPGGLLSGPESTALGVSEGGLDIVSRARTSGRMVKRSRVFDPDDIEPTHLQHHHGHNAADHTDATAAVDGDDFESDAGDGLSEADSVGHPGGRTSASAGARNQKSSGGGGRRTSRGSDGGPGAPPPRASHEGTSVGGTAAGAATSSSRRVSGGGGVPRRPSSSVEAADAAARSGGNRPPTWCAAHVLATSAGPAAGEIYEGETLPGDIPHGYGTCAYRNGLMYEGQWEHGTETGWGTISDVDDIVLYQGDLLHGALTGSGEDAITLRLNTVRQFSRVWHRDYTSRAHFNYSSVSPSCVPLLSIVVMQYTGKVFFGNGDRFTGQLRDGLFHGRGYYTSVSCGASYDGDWSDGQRNGNGVMIYGDSSRYSGQWRLGSKHGRGELVSASGHSYKGNWTSDVMDGACAREHDCSVQSVLLPFPFFSSSSSQARHFIPSFICNHPFFRRRSSRQHTCAGKGELTYPDGGRFDGTFKDGKRDGRGTYSFPDDQQISGRWVADTIEENGASCMCYAL